MVVLQRIVVTLLPAAKLQQCSHCVVSVLTLYSVISLSHFFTIPLYVKGTQLSLRCLMTLRSSLNEWLALKMAVCWSPLSGIAGGLSLCASARGSSGLRVWPIKKSLGFIHYDPPFMPQEKQKICVFLCSLGSVAAQMLWKSSFMFPKQNGKLSKHGNKILPASCLARCRWYF